MLGGACVSCVHVALSRITGSVDGVFGATDGAWAWRLREGRSYQRGGSCFRSPRGRLRIGSPIRVAYVCISLPRKTVIMHVCAFIVCWCSVWIWGEGFSTPFFFSLTQPSPASGGRRAVVLHCQHDCTGHHQENQPQGPSQEVSRQAQ